MTEVPEHLLARSKQARAKATGGGGDAGAEAPVAKAEATESAGTEVATTAAAAAPAVVEPPKPVPPFVAAAQARPRIPRFAIPVLASLPVWALIYAGTLTSSGPTDPELALGEQIYVSACSGCHAADGSGGTGRPLLDVLATFPDRQGHIDWVVNGSPEKGTPYGDPNREGGQRISQQGFTAMPGFADSLTAEEIAAVVRYERERFGGEEAAPAAGDAEGVDAENGETETGNAEGGSAENQAQTEGGGDGSGGETPASDASPAGDSGGDTGDAGGG